MWDGILISSFLALDIQASSKALSSQDFLDDWILNCPHYYLDRGVLKMEMAVTFFRRGDCGLLTMSQNHWNVSKSDI